MNAYRTAQTTPTKILMITHAHPVYLLAKNAIVQHNACPVSQPTFWMGPHAAPLAQMDIWALAESVNAAHPLVTTVQDL